ncbi:acyltransferase [Colletotrichum karsti]|uniref:Acyltransferase n=1 Tax=Colletotrichum karsti TaxID=1095194 RepID=A0A9P6I6F6_9PEZI|nr:acyltransferase [Colletotrichum karsti]KAF9878153.1 acyltransferase [Colletotrichum karsti]
MAESEKLGERVHNLYEESVDTMRGWFNGAEPDEAATGLLEEDEDVERGPHEDEDVEPPPPTSPIRRSCAAVDPRKALHLFCYFLPSFFTRLIGLNSEDSEIAAANSTSYLNGLRGIASLVVAFQHNLVDFRMVFHGWGETATDHYIMQLPFIRLMTNGLFMVCVFFVISGFALTYGPLKKIYAKQNDAAISSFPSSIFRRPIRLFLPVVPVLMMTIFSINIQTFRRGGRIHPPIPNGLVGQLSYFWQQLVIIITVGKIDSIMPQGWTLAAEFQGSLLVFTCTLAFARTSPKVRIPCVLMITAFFYSLGLWQSCLFLAGMLLADLRHLRAKLPSPTGKFKIVADVAPWLLLFVALFLGGWPIEGDPYKATHYGWLAWVPTWPLAPWQFFLSFSAITLVAALESLPILQRGLNCKFVLYLGEISYGLYLLHWLVAYVGLTMGLKYRLVAVGHSLQFSSALVVALSMFLAFWAADVHWRMIDKKSVKFAHWLSKKCGV